MKTYTLKLKSGFASTRYILYDGSTLMSDSEVTTLFSSDGTAYFIFNYGGSTPPTDSAVSIYSTNTNTVLAKFHSLGSGQLDEVSVYKATWRGLPTTYTYREVDTFRKMATDEAYGLTADQLRQLITMIESKNNNYSTSEIDTGYTWIDGSEIYKKTIDTGALPNNAMKTVQHGVGVNLKRAIKIEGYAYSPNFGTNMLMSGPEIAVQVAGVDIEITSSADFSAFTESYVTLYYTKTQ